MNKFILLVVLGMMGLGTEVTAGPVSSDTGAPSHGKGQKTGRSGDSVALHDDGTVMQRSTGLKNRAEQIARKNRIQANAAFDEGPQTDVALDHDQRSHFMV